MYINTYVIPIPEERKDDYIRIAELYVEIARDYGAVEIFENWESEIPDGELTDYRKAVKAEPGEKIINSWVIWPDRETGDRAHKSMMEDPRMAEFGEMPFDGKRMIFGGFEPMVTFSRR